MKKIQFTKTVQYQNEGRNHGPVYEQGKVYEFRDDLAERWLRRQVAVEVKESVQSTAHPPSINLDQQKGGRAERASIA